MRERGFWPDFHGRLAPSRAFVNKTSDGDRSKSIYRYPVKGLSPEKLCQRAGSSPARRFPPTGYTPSRTGPSGFDPAAPAYLPKTPFPDADAQRAAGDARTRYDDATHTLVIVHEGREAARGDLSTKEGRLAIEAFFRRFMPARVARPAEGAGRPTATASRTSPRRWCRSSISRRSRRSRPWSARRSIRCASAPISMSTGWPAWHEFESGRRTRSRSASAAQGGQADHALRGDRRRSRHRHPRPRDSRDADADLRSCGLRHLCAGDRGRRDRAVAAHSINP